MSVGAIRSMTGFGRAARETSIGRLTVEARALNSRYLEINVRLPRELAIVEMEVRALVRDFVGRGKVDLFLSLDAAPREYKVDAERASALISALSQIASLVDDKVRVEHVLAAGDVMRTGEMQLDDNGRGEVLACVRDALDALSAHRRTEGLAMAQDLNRRVADLRSSTDAIAASAATIPEKSLSQIKEALSRLQMSAQLDPGRLEAEAALLAQRADVTEEITRLRLHLEAVGSALEGGGAVGRKLDFLIQEIQREINTVGSKAAMGGVSSLVVEFKTELEKIREQAQNLE